MFSSFVLFSAGFVIGSAYWFFPVNFPPTEWAESKTFTYNFFPKSPKSVQKKRLPDALIIGVKKSGTGALIEFVRMHPDVAAPKTEEVHFFDMFYDKGIEYYYSKLPFVTPDQILMEKTPAYFHVEEVTQLIMDTFGPNVKFIIVVRDPIDRMISDYTHDHVLHFIEEPFHDLAFRVNPLTAQREVNASFEPVLHSNYIKHLRRFLNVGFKLENFLFIDGDKLSENPGHELQTVERFLGIRPMFTESMFYYDDVKGFPCVRLHAQFADGTIREGGLGTKENPRACLDKSKGRPDEIKPHLTEEEREMFVRYFAPLNRQFFEIIGFEIPSWQCVDPDHCF